MADVFISYAHEDVDFVRRMVGGLEASGLSVWWDHTIPPGETWDDFIAGGIRDAKACIVVWSNRSHGSDWVKEEATVARGGGKYVPVQVDEAGPPMGFQRIQAANLAGWNGEPNNEQWQLLTKKVHALVGGTGQPATAAAPGYRAPPRAAPAAAPFAAAPAPASSPPKYLIPALAALGVLIVGAFLWSGSQHKATQAMAPVTVTETAPDPAQQAEIDRLREEKNDALAAAQRAQDQTAALQRSQADQAEQARQAQQAAEQARAQQQAQANRTEAIVGSWTVTYDGGKRVGMLTFNSDHTFYNDWDKPVEATRGTWSMSGTYLTATYSSGAHTVMSGYVSGSNFSLHWKNATQDMQVGLYR